MCCGLVNGKFGYFRSLVNAGFFLVFVRFLVRIVIFIYLEFLGEAFSFFSLFFLLWVSLV